MKGKRRSRIIKTILDSGWSALLGNVVLIFAFIWLAVKVGKAVDPQSAYDATMAANKAATAANARWITKVLNHRYIALYMRVITEALKDGVAVSVIIVDIVLLGISRIHRKIDSTLEEEVKSNADHHALIFKYGAYTDTMDWDHIGATENRENYVSESGNGEKLLCWQYRKHENLKNIKKLDKIILKEYLGYAGKKNVDIKKAKADIDKYIKGYTDDKTKKVFPPGIVKIPDVCLFVNTEGKDGGLTIVFDDDPTPHELPDFIESHAVDIMNAHKTSKSDNKLTMRLKGMDYDRDSHLLTFRTERTNYIHMMLTNRCMDFPIGNGISVRSLYEYRDYVQPLNTTILGNQIGVEGLIITNDGYTLIEKRNHKYKTTWRNKFAQPISLSMGCKDLGITKAGQKLGMNFEEADDAIKKMLKKHLEGFGLIMGEDYQFDFAQNFLGLSRDLVEGGKPNVYFYVVVDMNHKQLEDLLIKRAYTDPTEPDDPSLNEEERKKTGLVKDDNISKKLYLYKLDDIDVNYNYVMKMDMTKAVRVCRRRKYVSFKGEGIGDRIENFVWNIKEILDNNSDKAKMVWRKTVRNFFKLLKKDRKGLYEKECGEAFLGCLAFYRMCQNRIDADYKDEKHIKIEKKEKNGNGK